MEWIKSFFISKPEASALPTHTPRSPTPPPQPLLISKPEAPAPPTHTQRSPTPPPQPLLISKPEAPAPPTHTQRSPTPPPTPPPPTLFQAQDMGKAILNLAFSATIGPVVFLFSQGSLTTEVDPPFSLSILGIAILIAFSASFLAMSLHHSGFSGAAVVLEHTGIVSTVVAFFSLMSFLLPSSFQWLDWAACVVSLLGYVIAHVKRFPVTDAGGVEGR